MSDAPDGVVAIASAVRTGALSAREVIADHLRLIEASQPSLNAFTLIDSQRALATARSIDESVAAGLDPGPLAGVPIAVKDLIDHAGRPNTLGSSFTPRMPDATAPAVARLEEAGAVVVGRVGLHEFAFGFSSENHWFGPVRNPWGTRLSPGGSSGGSGAAVAARLAAAALGTDTGGSVRVPAALCGIVGLKVTHGRVPLRGVYPLGPSVDTVGPLARNTTDAAAVYQVIAGYDAADEWSIDRPVVRVSEAAELGSIRVGVPHPWVDAPLSAAESDGFAGALDRLTDAGALIVPLEMPDLQPPGQIINALYPEVAAVHRERFASHPEGYGPTVAARVAEAVAVPPELYQVGLEWRTVLRAVVDEALEQVDFLATPTVAALRKDIGVATVRIQEADVPYRMALSHFTSLVNQLLLPAVALPLNANGTPPPSVQFIGPAWSEHRLLELGMALESAGIVATRRPPDW